MENQEECEEDKEDDENNGEGYNGHGNVFGKSGNILENNSIVFFEKEEGNSGGGNELNKEIMEVTETKNKEVREQKRQTMRDDVVDTIKYLDA